MGGRLVSNAGDGRTAYVSREDCAAVAAAVLTSDGHEGRTYDVTGPQLLGQTDVAALLAGWPTGPWSCSPSTTSPTSRA